MFEIKIKIHPVWFHFAGTQASHSMHEDNHFEGTFYFHILKLLIVQLQVPAKCLLDTRRPSLMIVLLQWVADGSPSHSTPVKIETSNQFVPMGSNPKEFKRVQKLMKEGRRLGGVHAGPESKVLDGLSWEEAQQMHQNQVTHVDGGGYMKVGAASKGIIQRDFQHNATVYKSPYAKNPFDMVSNEELEEYKRIINNKNGRESGVMSPASPMMEDTLGDTTDAGETRDHRERNVNRH